ncbi:MULTISPECIES: hypothetical protein [Nocardia]|uniref:hypothetical protein n=1 Tax=Nocardia TaxID=1817 RepID=UPI000BEF5AE7|nr:MULTISPECIES: hypothetical protein [Nocardia]PEH76431.1 hypothetical protein CRM89_10905 [Nocardia sp. FDAARGOS_372]UEX20788.1 hypothetical protein LMJ57_17320 [Nocardia farcinica]SUE27714.1 Uncharacterised protein [Nocardia farcinica]
MSLLPTLTAWYPDVLAQIENYTPEAPPGVGGLQRLMRWVQWLTLLSGVAAIIFAGGRFAWEKWHGGMLESPKMVLGALIGGTIATSAGTIMNTIISNS